MNDITVTMPRFGFGMKSTLGRFILNGTHLCYTVEDARRDAKIPAVTCIPEGVYRITLYKAGEKHKKYAQLYPEMHRGMLLINDVPNFVATEIHGGNDENDTEGCVCVGAAPLVIKGGEFWVQQSQDTYKMMYPKIAGPLVAGDRVFLDVKTFFGPAHA